MWIYFLQIFLVVIIILIYDISKKKIFFNIGLILLCILSGFRYYVGTDFGNYKIFFDNINISRLDEQYEILFFYTSKLIRIFTDNTQIYFIIFSSIIVILIMKYIFENSNEKYFSVLLFMGLGYYYTSFNIMRQYIAIAIVTYAIKYIKYNNNFKFYISIFIAIGFHSTAIIALPLKVLMDIKWKKITYIYLSIVSIFIYCFFYNYINIVFALFKKYNEYSNSYFLTTGANKITILIFISIFIFGILNRSSLIDGINNIELKMVFIGIIFLLFGTKGLLLSRLSSYFTIVSITLIPNSLRYYIRSRYILKYIIIILVLIYFGVFINTQGGLIPYKICNIFFK